MKLDADPTIQYAKGSWGELSLDDLKLDSPLTGSARLPGIRFNDNGKSYRQLMLNAAISDATTLTVFVDLQSQRVVSVMPPDATLTELPGNAHITPSSGPNGD